ncbi:MAG: Holliday junction resolvase RuvX [Rickettsiaceae bacterium H1]|nr:Holliday junction resolvase RuvX [Rickettsiaceae bacterium H1]
MIFTDIRKFLPYLINGKRIMGLDLGEKNIGIAFSDRKIMISSPHSTYKRVNIKKDFGYINFLFKKQDCTAIVIGFPENSEIKDRLWVEKIFAFAEKISQKYRINVYMQDETLSTKEAITALSFLSKSKTKKINDKIAASCILNRTLNIINKLC